MIVWMSAAAWAATCDLSGPIDGAFTERADSSPAALIVEVRTTGASPGWTTAIAEVVSARGAHAVFVAAIDPEALRALAPLAEAGHEVALDLTGKQLGTDPLLEAEALKAAGKMAGKILGKRPRTVVSALPKRTVEAIIGYSGMRAVLEIDGAADGIARQAASYQGQVQPTIVLPGGPYRGACGSDPSAGPLTPAAADRAAVALRVATDEPAVVRIVLDGARGSPDDAAVLGRWLDEVIVPAGIPVATPSELRGPMLIALESRTAPVVPSGRFVVVEDVKLAAVALAEVRTLPRTLPGDLVPAEAFLAFARVLTGEAEGDVVQLGDLAGPRADAKTTLTGPVEVTLAEVQATAKALLLALPDHVPASMPVGGRLFTASEVLLLFASAVRGDAVPTTRPVAAVDPNEEGLGWGVSRR